ncbi:MAG: cell division protein ZapB [Candidatus Binatia bacterium]
MTLESLKILEEKVVGVLARHEKIRAERADLAARLEAQERAYTMLLERLQQYEQERHEMKERLEKVLDRLVGLDI